MKKISMIMVFICVLIILTGISQLYSQNCGDVDSNESVDITDVFLITQKSVGISSAVFNASLADVNGDNRADIVDALLVGAIKTFIGSVPGVVIKGYIQMRHDKKEYSVGKNHDTYNIIIRNLAVQGDHCEGMCVYRDGEDAVYIGQDTHHVWVGPCGYI